MTADDIARLEALMEKTTPSTDAVYPGGTIGATHMRFHAESLESDLRELKSALPELLKAARNGESERMQIKAAVNRLNALANYGKLSRLLKAEIIGVADSLTPPAVARINAAKEAK